MHQAQTVSITIQRSSSDVFAYLADPRNLPRWSVFVTAIDRAGDDWVATTTNGAVHMRFAPPNAFGIVDHWVTPRPKQEVYVPLRVVPNGRGSEVLFTVFRLPEMTDREFDDDLGMVETDLDQLKRVLETTA